MLESFSAVIEWELVFAAFVSVISGVMHGYAGFGAAVLMIPWYFIIYGPIEAVSIMAIVAFISSLQAIPPASHIANWREVIPCCIGMVIFIPLGAIILFFVDAEIVRLIMGICVMGGAVAMMFDWSYKGRRSFSISGIAGAISGFMCGVAGVGGPAIVMYFLSDEKSVAVQRANTVISIEVAAIIILISVGVGGGVDTDTIARSTYMLPTQIFGFWLGGRLFGMGSPKLYRRIALSAAFFSGAVAIFF